MSSEPRTTVGLLLKPVDVLFFRDGRPFTPASRGASGLPSPQTFAGAVRSALIEMTGGQYGQLEAHRPQTMAIEDLRTSFREAGIAEWIVDQLRFRGPWLYGAASKDQTPEVLYPVPASLHRSKSQSEPMVYRLDPFQGINGAYLPGWQAEQGLALWPSQRVDGERLNGYLTATDMRSFLSGGIPSQSVISSKDLFDFDYRTGVAIDADTQAAQETFIYAATFLVLKGHVQFYAEVEVPQRYASFVRDLEVLRFGGEGRRVTVQTQDPFVHPTAPPDVCGDGVLLVLTTPGYLGNAEPLATGEHPHLLNKPPLAAAVSAFSGYSGWDLAVGGPKPNRFAAAAGSVFFLDHDVPEPAEQQLTNDELDARNGWGCFLKGVWNYVKY